MTTNETLAIHRIDEISAAIAAETGRVSAEIAGAANDLDSQTTNLRKTFETFTSQLRAA